MTSLLPSLPPLPLLSAFMLASFVLAVTPGPGVFYIVTRTLAQGRRVGLASVLGVAAGNLGNAVGASIGLAALFAVSALAFAVVKYAGAAYLVYLGVAAFRTKRAEALQTEVLDPPVADIGKVFRDGFVVALLNPKTALFFAAFLPQFLLAPSVQQSVLLGVISVAIAAITDSTYALAAGSIAPALRKAGKAGRVQNAGRYLTAGAFIGLGLFTAFGGARSSAK